MDVLNLVFSTSVAGLFTYIILDYLSLLDTEKREIRNLFLVLFSLINMLIYLNLSNKFLAIGTILLLSFFVFPVAIYIIRIIVNRYRRVLNKPKLIHSKTLDFVFSAKDVYFYTEIYNSSKELINSGYVIQYRIDDNGNSNIVIDPVNELPKSTKVKAKDTVIYHEVNSSMFYKIFYLPF